MSNLVASHYPFIDISLPKFKAELVVSNKIWTKNVNNTKETRLPLPKFQKAYYDTWMNATPDLRTQMSNIGTQFCGIWASSEKRTEDIIQFILEAMPDENMIVLRTYSIVSTGVIDQEIIYDAYIKAWLSYKMFLYFNSWPQPATPMH